MAQYYEQLGNSVEVTVAYINTSGQSIYIEKEPNYNTISISANISQWFGQPFVSLKVQSEHLTETIQIQPNHGEGHFEWGVWHNGNFLSWSQPRGTETKTWYTVRSAFREPCHFLLLISEIQFRYKNTDTVLEVLSEPVTFNVHKYTLPIKHQLLGLEDSEIEAAAIAFAYFAIQLGYS